MLVLTRKIGEEIIINDNIIIKYLKINDKREISLGIQAPKNINIIRKEIKNKFPNFKKMEIEYGQTQ